MKSFTYSLTPTGRMNLLILTLCIVFYVAMLAVLSERKQEHLLVDYQILNTAHHEFHTSNPELLRHYNRLLAEQFRKKP